MSISSDTLRRLAALDLPAEAMAEVLSIFADMQGAEEERLRKQRDRKQRSRDKEVLVTGPDRDEGCDQPPRKEKSPHTPLKKTNPLVSPNGDTPARESFDAFWEAYPRREGDNPRKPARLKFEIAVRKGAAPERIIAGAKALAAKHPIPTPFVPQAVTWLNQERWNDVEPTSTGPPVRMGRTVEEIIAESEAGRAAAG